MLTFNRPSVLSGHRSYHLTTTAKRIMIIVCHVDSLLKDRGYRSRRQLALEVGMSPWALGFLARNKYKAVSFKTVKKLCAALDCQPGDIFTLQET